ncbi:camp-dependent protein kinase catalytic subunit [Boothiomyces sp. JEL0838]|nr:camp-dependent protein kinase catalytic subunit [Boothiomyces sp. JEL0838]
MATIRRPKDLTEPNSERQSPNISVTDRRAPRKVNTIDSAIAGINKLSIQEPKAKISLKDFHIEKTLGTGSFGRVHLVKYKEDNKYYAMKVLRKADIVKMRQVEHTINEKRILEKLGAPFVVHMLTSFHDNSNVYFVLEYVQGGELFTFLRKSSRFPNHVAKFYAAENILINAQGHIKITDFGFAKQVTEQTWTLCGTPDYLAPEIIQSKGYGSAVDWWALGILIYEMVAGYPPFFHEDPMKLYENILACKPKFSTSFDPTCKDLVKRLLVVDLTKRFGNLKGGVEDIKRHKWFLGVDWEKLNTLQVAAPYVPPIKGENDTSQFDSYPEEYEPYGQTGKDPYLEYFKDF